MLPKLLTLVLSASLSGAVYANEQKASGGPEKTVNPERGWFWFEQKPEPEPEPEPPPKPEPKPEEPKPEEPKPEEPKEDKCKKVDTWSPECGFVDPGTDFSWQAKQRDALMERMAVAKNDPKAVEAFQYYMWWVIGRAAEVTAIWRYNMAQNPELDPSVNEPVSAFGLKLMTDVRTGKAQEVYDLIRKEGGFLVYFSKHDCNFCHQMGPTFTRLAKETNLPVRNAALDDKCMPSFEEGCMTAPSTIPAAQALQVTTVPTLFLHVKPNTWIRVATGVVDLQSMKLRVEQFFQAYRTAVINGVDNGGGNRAPVDFSNSGDKGSTKTDLGSKDTHRMPTEEEVRKMMGGK